MRLRRGRGPSRQSALPVRTALHGGVQLFDVVALRLGAATDHPNKPAQQSEDKDQNAETNRYDSRIALADADLLPSDPFGVLQALLVSLAFAAGYVMTYPAIEVESPTLVMIQAIARRGDEGLARATLFEQLNDEVLVAPRVRDLLSEGLAVEQEGRLHLSARGRRLVNLIFIWRRVLGAGEGG